jgi:hypothetical protein
MLDGDSIGVAGQGVEVFVITGEDSPGRLLEVPNHRTAIEDFFPDLILIRSAGW